MPDVVTIGTIDSPFGRLGVVLSPRGLARLTLPNEPLEHCTAWAQHWLPGASLSDDPTPLAPLEQQMAAYSAGRRQNFRQRLDLRGTPFQLAVWRALRKVGYGQTMTYAELAAAVGHPTAARAVGAAVGDNPVAIIVPCHRIIGSDGSLVGYAGGLPLKRQLLELEGALKPEPPRLVQQRLL